MINKIVFAGKDASRALGMSSVKPEDVSPKWEDLSDKEKGVLEDWYVFLLLLLLLLGCVADWIRFVFFSKRYNKVGLVV